ncbi:MAG: hypothetical protein C0483_16420 [Pirellula sp.]|nr:hypothetical protein [Pirellula sp.]
MFRTAFGLALAATLLACGCAEFQDLSISARNHKAAAGAWKQARWDYWRQGVPHKVREHLGRGFEQGYYDVASGSNGAIPLFPPNYYWGTRYQTPEGTAYIGAWFRGYQDGAMAAERDGLALYNQIPTSWAPGQQASTDRPLNEVPGLNPAMIEGEPLPPIPHSSVAPVVPLQPQPELPNAVEPMPLTVPMPPGNTLPPPPVVPALPGKTTELPAIPDAPTTGKATTSGAPVTAPTNEAKPAAPQPVLRDPIGGKQTQFETQTSEAPVAQAALFGDSLNATP